MTSRDIAEHASNRQRELLAADRWAWLTDYLATWCAEPLRAHDGHSIDDIRAAYAGASQPPTALVEWLELVGRRLHEVMNLPVILGHRWWGARFADDGAPVIWSENQGVWAIIVDGEGDDPLCRIDGEACPGYPALATRTVSEWLQTMTLADTLVGAGGDGDQTREGPLGDLVPTVAGGTIEDPTDEVRRAIRANSSAPDLPPWPSFPIPLRTAPGTLLQDSDWELEWATATTEALSALRDVVDLRSPDGVDEVTLTIRSREVGRRYPVGEDGGGECPYRLAADDTATPRGSVRTNDWLRVSYATRDLGATADAVWAKIEPDLRGSATITARTSRGLWLGVLRP